MANEHILGIWDGHDSGAAVVAGGRIVAAINEERLTRRKLESRFPRHSIAACLKCAGLSPEDVVHVAISTTDPAKTLSRLVPRLKEEYYLFRRRKKGPGALEWFRRMFKFKFTELPPVSLSRWLSAAVVGRELRSLGFKRYSLHWTDHHDTHAAAAAFTSGFDRALVLTIDGIGDALSGSVQVLQDGRLSRIATLPGTSSLGIFYEQVTMLLNLRELEDEGKVMALSNYAFAVPDQENPLLDFFRVDGMTVKAKHDSWKMCRELRRILWGIPPERFAYMAQRVLEVKVLDLVRNCLKETGMDRIALAGGVASNIKVNRLINNLPGLQDVFVFPHMGDGGLALGSALCVNQRLNGVSHYPLKDLYLGSEPAREEIESALRGKPVAFRSSQNVAKEAAELLAQGRIVLWYQGRMEFGPRALGHRSILALPGCEKIKERLNLILKKRVWYQPFCPSMLVEDARELLADLRGTPNRFMTMSYLVKEEYRDKLKGVIHIDGTCRPQILSQDQGDERIYLLLKELKRLTGLGVILNTSFNIHGEPIVCSPEDAVRTFTQGQADCLVLGDYMVTHA